MRNKDTKAATERFRKAIDHVIAEHIKTKGKVQSYQDFARAIGITPANLSKYNTHSQHVTLHILIASCRKFKINPTYVLLGEGEIFLSEGDSMEKRLLRLERLVK